MRAWSWHERVAIVLTVLALGVAVAQGIGWLAGGMPSVGPLLVLMMWTQFSRARSHRLRCNSSRAENHITITLAALTALIAVAAVIVDRSTQTVVVSVVLFAGAVAAVVGVSLNGPPSAPDADPRRSTSSPSETQT